MAHSLPAVSRLTRSIPPLSAPAMANAGGERDAGLMAGAIDAVVDKRLVYQRG